MRTRLVAVATAATSRCSSRSLSQTNQELMLFRCVSRLTRIPKITNMCYSRIAPWMVVGGASIDWEPTTTIIALVLGLVGFVCLCWLLFVLAVHALPFLVGATAALAAYHSGSGLVAAVIAGAIASAITFRAGQIAFARRRSPLIRATTALLFAIPAAIAGYYATLGLAHLLIPVEAWREATAIMARS
jgi:hypothetical protein